jgi:hypothetical protein
LPMIAGARRKIRSASIPLLALALLLGAGGVGWARVRDVAESEARELVVGALDPSARHLPKLAVDPYVDAKAPAPDFYEFAVTWDNANGSVIVGFFAVNRATGDVWKLVVCRKVERPRLRQLQGALRRKISLSHEELVRLTDKAPCEP